MVVAAPYKETHTMKTTIIIPNHNGIRHLDACLQSLLADLGQFDGDTPVIVVDDASTDGSPAHLAARYPAVTVITLPEKSGFCHAVNSGIRAAATEYVILLNNDTTVRPGFCAALTQALADDPRAFSAAALMLRMDDPTRIDNAGDLYNALGWAYGRGKNRILNNTRYEKRPAIFSACAGAAIYRRDLLIELGLFDEAHFAYLEDADIGYAARLRGYTSRFCPAAVVLHVGSASSGSRYNPAKTDLASRNSVYLIAKNMPLPQIILNLPILLPGFFIKFLFFCTKKMGLRYLRGLANGLKLSFSPAAKARRVRFRPRHLRHYIRVQLELYANIFRR